MNKLGILLACFILMGSLSATWLNNSYSYRNLIDCTNVTTGTPVVINGSSGFTLQGSKQIVWVACRPNLYLYFNSASAYMVGNNTTQFAMEVEQGNNSNYGNVSAMWTSINATNVYHGIGNATLVDSLNLANLTARNTSCFTQTANAKIGYAMNFSMDCYWNGSNTYTPREENSSTTSLWAYQTISSSGYTMTHGAVSSATLEKLAPMLSASGKIAIVSSSTTVTSSFDMTNNSWISLGINYTAGAGANWGIYSNTTMENKPTTGNPKLKLGELILGQPSWAVTGNGFRGMLDEIRIYNASKNATFIGETYNNTLGLNGYGTLGALESNAIVIMQTATILPLQAFTNETLKGYCNASDSNGANVSYNYKWYLNNGLYSSSQNITSCYQESANISTACGGLNNGSYNVSDAWNDENWDTYTSFAQAGQTNYRYVNYSTPINSSASWNVKSLNAAFQPGRGINITMNASCFYQSRLQLRLMAVVPAGCGTNSTVTLQCYNNSDWNTISKIQIGDCSAIFLYEEAMWWITATNNYQQNLEINVANLSNVSLAIGQNWTFECNAYNVNGSSYLNSSVKTIQSLITSYAVTGFVDSTSSHSFLVNGTAIDARGGSFISSTQISTSAGSCSYVSNASSGTSFNVTYNCTSISPATPTIQITFVELNGETVNNSSTHAYPDNMPLLTKPAVTSQLSNISNATCNQGTFTDPDGDVEDTSSRAWVWYLDGVVLGGQTNQILNLQAIGADYGNKISCKENSTAQVWTTSSAANTSTNVSITSLIPCVPSNSSKNSTAINYLIFDANSYAPINASAILTISQSLAPDFTITSPLNTTHRVCIIPNSSNVLATISEAFAATGYYSIIQMRPIANYSDIPPTNISIYMVNTSGSQKQVIITTIDNNLQPVSGVFVKTEQQNTTSGSYYQIIVSETDNNGITAQILTPNTIFYKFTVLDVNNTVLETYQPQLIACALTDTVCYVTLTVGAITELPYASTFQFTNATCSWNNSSGALSCAPTGVSPATISLIVTLMNSTTYNSSVCSQTGVGNATVTCILPITSGNCYNFAFGAVMTTGETQQLGGGQICISAAPSFTDRSGIGLIITFVLVAVLGLLGLAFGAAGVFIGASFGLIIAIAFGALTGIAWFGGIMGILMLWILAWVVK